MYDITPTSTSQRQRKPLTVEFERIEGVSAAALTVRTGSPRDPSCYWLDRVACQLPGRSAFRLRKMFGFPGTDHEADEYYITMADMPSDGDTCECRGYLRHSHCKHLDVLRDLRARGEI